MSDQLTKRLNAILPKITSRDFLSGQGIGNEVPFYVFDYPPENELQIREYIAFIEEKLPKQAPDLNFMHVNMFDFLVGHIKDRGYFERVLQKERERGSAEALKSIKSIGRAEKLAPHLAREISENRPDLILLSGVGSAYPIVRTHELLNQLQSPLGLTPLVIFYPGVYDMTTLKLFGKSSLSINFVSSFRQKKARYYRAFRLID